MGPKSSQKRGQKQHQRHTPYEYDEQRIKSVVNLMHKEKDRHPDIRINVADWARNEGVDYQRLERRWSGRVSSLLDRLPTRTRLN